MPLTAASLKHLGTGPLRVDPLREKARHGTTGCYIRAVNGEGVVADYDIAELDKVSLLRFLRTGGQKNELAENTVGMLLGHGPLVE